MDLEDEMEYISLDTYLVLWEIKQLLIQPLNRLLSFCCLISTNTSFAYLMEVMLVL